MRALYRLCPVSDLASEFGHRIGRSSSCHCLTLKSPLCSFTWGGQTQNFSARAAQCHRLVSGQSRCAACTSAGNSIRPLVARYRNSARSRSKVTDKAKVTLLMAVVVYQRAKSHLRHCNAFVHEVPISKLTSARQIVVPCCLAAQGSGRPQGQRICHQRGFA